MDNRSQIFYGGVPVPYTASWTGESSLYVARCRFAGRSAVCQTTARGAGKPLFGKPHMVRQREVIALDLCDLCGRPLKIATKVSLSHARPFAHGHQPGDILQFEPMLHKLCAARSLAHCPSLKRDVARGTVQIRQVTRHRVQFAIMNAPYVEEQTGERCEAIGHAKVQLLRWVQRDADWLATAPLSELRHG